MSTVCEQWVKAEPYSTVGARVEEGGGDEAITAKEASGRGRWRGGSVQESETK